MQAIKCIEAWEPDLNAAMGWTVAGSQECITGLPYVNTGVHHWTQAEVDNCGYPPGQPPYHRAACVGYNRVGNITQITKAIIYVGGIWRDGVLSEHWPSQWRQFAIAHEFGHVVGLRDHGTPYCTPMEDTGNPTIMSTNWNSDVYPCMSRPNMFDVAAVMCETYHYPGCTLSFGFVLGGGSEPDADGDAIPDADDNCIGSVNSMQEDRDSDGSGNVVITMTMRMDSATTVSPIWARIPLTAVVTPRRTMLGQWTSTVTGGQPPLMSASTYRAGTPSKVSRGGASDTTSSQARPKS